MYIFYFILNKLSFSDLHYVAFPFSPYSLPSPPGLWNIALRDTITRYSTLLRFGGPLHPSAIWKTTYTRETTYTLQRDTAICVDTHKHHLFKPSTATHHPSFIRPNPAYASLGPPYPVSLFISRWECACLHSGRWMSFFYNVYLRTYYFHR